MEKPKQVRDVKRSLRVNDFTCQLCRVQATRENDHICEICKAIGKSAEPITADISWQDFLLATEFTREIFFWFKHWEPTGFVGKLRKSV